MDEIALALGGGGVKGMAHIGVIRRLEQEGYKIRAIAGTSAGGLVGAVYAAGYNSTEIENIIHGMNRARLFSRGSGEGPGLMGLSGLANTLLDVLGERRFVDLNIPFACTAVDLHSAQEIILSQGRVLDAVLATIAVPGIFPPKAIGNTLLIDGGVMDPVPVALARWLAPNLPVIASVLTPVPEGWRHLPSTALSILPAAPIPLPSTLLETFSRNRLTQAFNIFTRSIDITSLMMAELRLHIERPDAIIRPDVHHHGMLDEVDPHEMIWLGEKATAETLAEVQRSLAWHKRLRRRFQRVAPPGKIFSPSTQGGEDGATGEEAP